jgi:heterodisulfide reductase subunit C
MDYTPRQIFAMIQAGMKEEVLKSNTPWYCVSCYYCTVRCPQEVQITELMYSLKRGAIEEGYFQEEDKVSEASAFSGTFVDLVENYGRSFELGLATRYHLRHHPLDAVKMATGLGLEMFRKGRMDLKPNRIEDLDQLQAILAEAKSLGGKR